MKCNGDCFNCVFDDCINNSVTPVNKTEKANKKELQRERKKEYMRRYNAEHKEHNKKLMANWRERNPDYSKNYYWSKKRGVAVE